MKRPQRRFTEHTPIGKRVVVLKPYHVAVKEARPLFPSRVVEGDRHPLKPGAYQRKIGSHVVKGAWSGMPVYCLTLPERTTCPRSCGHWRDCYGNKMNWAKRHKPGAALEFALRAQVAELAARHPNGFVVRLHILGDFYSVHYVTLWAEMMVSFPALHVWGYTARHGDDISKAVSSAALRFRSRWAIRHSDAHPEGYSPQFRTVTIDREEDCPPDAVVCPVQTGKTECCGTCALCWSSTKAIAFLRH